MQKYCLLNHFPIYICAADFSYLFVEIMVVPVVLKRHSGCSNSNLILKNINLSLFCDTCGFINMSFIIQFCHRESTRTENIVQLRKEKNTSISFIPVCLAKRMSKFNPFFFFFSTEKMIYFLIEGNSLLEKPKEK